MQGVPVRHRIACARDEQMSRFHDQDPEDKEPPCWACGSISEQDEGCWFCSDIPIEDEFNEWKLQEMSR